MRPSQPIWSRLAAFRAASSRDSQTEFVGSQIDLTFSSKDVEEAWRAWRCWWAERWEADVRAKRSGRMVAGCMVIVMMSLRRG